MKKSQFHSKHLADLRKSGLRNKTIETMGAYSVRPADIPRLLGQDPKNVKSVLAFPYPNLKFIRFKVFPPYVDAKGHKVKYLQRAGSGVHLYILPSVRQVLADPSISLHFTEGEKKASKAVQESLMCIGLGGLWNWIEENKAIKEFDDIAWVNREVIFYPDSDVWARPDLQRAVYAFGREIEERGARFYVVVIPQKSTEKVGLDDYLVKKGAQQLGTLDRITLKHSALKRQSAWWKEWKARKTPQRTTEDPGKAILFSDPKPWPEKVEGETLLNEIKDIFCRHVILPDCAADTLALWTIHTYLLEATDVSPILAVTSPTPRCGKTLVLELLHLLVSRPLSTANITSAALFRTMEKFWPTLVVDEGDTFLSRSDELRGILNSGHRKSMAFVVRTVGDDYEPRQFTTWGAKAIALIGNLPATLNDRSIVLHMQRKTAEEKVKRFRASKFREKMESIRSKITRFAQDNLQNLKNLDEDIPQLDDRAADNWRPLLAIAHVAGQAWSELAHRAAVLLSGSESSEAGESVNITLLADLKNIFMEMDEDQLPTQDILRALVDLEDRPWPEFSRGKPLTARQLAKIMAPFGIRTRQLWIEGINRRGYSRNDFEDKWARYIAKSPLVPLGTENPKQFQGVTAGSEPLGNSEPSGNESELSDRNTKELADQADKDGWEEING